MTHFKKETELVKELSKYTKQIYKRKNGIYAVTQEESAGLGIFDFAIFDINKKKFLRRIKARLGTPITSESMLCVLLHLKPNKPRTFQYLHKKTGINASHLRTKALKYLIKNKYVVQRKNDTYEKNLSYSNFVKFCIAIEAKLEKWKAALRQAYRYKAFANETYVALSSKHIENALKNMERFKNMNVGLIEVEKNNGVRIIFRPKRETPKSRIAVQLCNEIVIKRYYRKFLSKKSFKALSQVSK